MSSEKNSHKNAFSLPTPPFPVQSAEELLHHKKTQRNLMQIQKLANAPKEHYDALYLNTLFNYARYVQTLPASQVSGYTSLGGLLELGIERSLRALTLYRKEFPLNGIPPEDMSRQWALYTYALFTAGLFYGVGQVAATYIVSLCDKRGRESARWLPLTGPMTNTSFSHFRYTLDSVNRDALAARATPLIAQLLMPRVGFEWIASDIEVLDYWLAILQNDEKYGGLLAKILMLAHQDLLEQNTVLDTTDTTAHTLETIEKDLTEFLQPTEKPPASAPEDSLSLETQQEIMDGLIAAGFGPSVEISASKILGPNGSESLGQIFVNWLRYIVGRKNPMATNVLIGRDSIALQGQEVIRAFMQENKVTADISTVVQALQKEFLSIARQASAGGVKTYFVINDVTLLLNGGSLPSSSSNISTPVTSKQSAYPNLDSSLQVQLLNQPMK